jgi:hypothetical protein
VFGSQRPSMPSKVKHNLTARKKTALFGKPHADR